MKYQFKLILRVFFAFILNPIFWYWILIWPSIILPYILLKIFGFDVSLSMNIFTNIFTIYSGNYALEFVEACVASSAYYLLTLLILMTKDIPFKRMLRMFIVGSLLILAMNIFRVVLIITVLLTFGGSWFNIIHLTFWKLVSTLYVFLVWILLIRWYKINNIPIYSDVKYLYNEAFKKNHDKKKKKR